MKVDAKTVAQKLEDFDDDWIQPFACNHVVVNLTPEKKKKSRKESDSESEKESKGRTVAPFCVMCGERVSSDSSSGDKIASGRRAIEASADTGIDPFERPDSSLSLLRKKTAKKPQLPRSRRISSSSVQSETSQSTLACTMHSHKKLKYFCEDHQELCCSVCINVLHSRCDRVMFIKDELNLSWDRKICTQTIEALQGVRVSFEEITDHNEKILENLEQKMKQINSRKDMIKSKMLSLLDDFERNCERQIEKCRKLAYRDYQTTIETCNDAINDVEKACQLLKLASRSNMPQDVFVATRKVLCQKERYGLALSDAVSHSRDMNIELLPEKNIENIENIDKIGCVAFKALEMRFPESVVASVSKIPKAEIRSPRTIRNVFSYTPSSPTPSARKATIHGKFNVRLAEDKDICENVGAEFLPDGRVAVIDMKNCKLKIFDAKFRNGASLPFRSGPRGIAVINPQEVAVSLPDENLIAFVSISKKLKLVRSILTNIPCYGIRYYSSELVVLCDDGFSKTEVQVLGLQGEIKRTFSMNKTGKSALRNPWYLALNPDGQRFYITDRGRLVCLDVSGTVMFEYKDTDLENARGVTIDSQGQLYVCGTSSNNIYEVSTDGNTGKVFISDIDITAPQAVCYNDEKRLLLVTSVGSEIVTIFKVVYS